jgi:hypothetical protein
VRWARRGVWETLRVNAGLADPKFKARLVDLGAIVLSGSPADFKRHIAEEVEKCGKVIRAANINRTDDIP